MIGNNLLSTMAKKWREESGLTLKDISIKSGIDVSTLWRFEQGTSSMKVLLVYMYLGFNVQEHIDEIVYI